MKANYTRFCREELASHIYGRNHSCMPVQWLFFNVSVRQDTTIKKRFIWEGLGCWGENAPFRALQLVGYPLHRTDVCYLYVLCFESEIFSSSELWEILVVIRTKCETVSVRASVLDEVESLEPVLEMAAFFCCFFFFLFQHVFLLRLENGGWTWLTLPLLVLGQGTCSGMYLFLS